MAFQFGKQYALIDNHYKIYGVSDGPTQLFNLLNDPSELKDLSMVEHTLLNRLMSVYQDWNTTVQSSQSGGDY